MKDHSILKQTHDMIGQDADTGWDIWKKSQGLGVLKGAPSKAKFIMVSEKGKYISFSTLAEFEVYKDQMRQAGYFKK